MVGAYKVLVRKFEQKRTVWWLRHKWEDVFGMRVLNE
jgi:hypothetical protein